MKRLITIIFLLAMAGCSSNNINSKNDDMDVSCEVILKDFFTEYDQVIKSRNVDTLEDYIDEGSRRWGCGKAGIMKKVRGFFEVIQQYDVTIKQCKKVDKDTILWEGYADYGNGVTQHSMGTGLIRKNGKWRMRVIEYRP
ncbi:MAG: hypothetical protein D6B27_12580 [Gammaproteobacteria bacterium]|nr:MAG: hypothetical protein D6B27_12580 [Gammaproteobacteria bacterium]